MVVMRQGLTSCPFRLHQAIHSTTARRARSITFNPSPVNAMIAIGSDHTASELVADGGSSLVHVMGRDSAVIHHYGSHQQLTPPMTRRQRSGVKDADADLGRIIVSML